MLTILTGDAIEQLRTLPDESMQCCVTSPPYWGLRDYGTAAWEGGDEGCDHKNGTDRNDSGKREGLLTGGPMPGGDRYYREQCPCGANRIDSQVGLEKTPEEYVAKMVEVFREVRRVLRKDGTLWLNLGDSYAGGNGRWGGDNRLSVKQSTNRGCINQESFPIPSGLKPKDLCGIPWRVAFALQADGWWLRSDIIWAKPNPMPESVTDRPTKSHEYLFLLANSANYFYDAEAIKERGTDRETFFPNNPRDGIDVKAGNQGNGTGNLAPATNRNKRSVWTVATAPYPEAHFATYPPDLIKPCIMAGTSSKGCCSACGAPWERIVERTPMRIDRSDRTHELGHTRSSGTMLELNHSETLGWQPTCKCDADVQSCVVLDPFGGSGTTGMVALELGRKAVLIELNPKYVELIRQRCDVTPGLQLA